MVHQQHACRKAVGAATSEITRRCAVRWFAEPNWLKDNPAKRICLQKSGILFRCFTPTVTSDLLAITDQIL
jgi:hypothetical protein